MVVAGGGGGEGELLKYEIGIYVTQWVSELAEMKKWMLSELAKLAKTFVYFSRFRAAFTLPFEFSYTD